MTKIKLPQPFVDFVTSSKFIEVASFLVFTLVMTVIVSSQNFLFQQIVENGISRRDVIAEKTIVV